MDDGWQTTEVESPIIVEIHADTAEKDSDVAGDEADFTKSAQTLFSWSEFMAEADCPRRRAAPASPNLPCPSSSGR